MKPTTKNNAAPSDLEGQLRELNEALLVSSVRQHELAELARKSEEALRAVQSQLRRNAETFSELVEQAPFGIYVVNSEFRIEQVNDGAQAAFRNVKPLIGRDFAEAIRIIWSEPYADEVISIFRRVLETGEPYLAPSLTERRRDLGSIESYEWQVQRITLADGRYGLVCYFFDTTQLREAERASALLASIVESTEDAVISKDLDGIISTWNRGAQHLFGYTAQEVIGKPVALLIPEDHLHEEPQILSRIRQGESVEQYETIRRRKDGSLVNISLTVSPIRDAAGRIIGASKIAHDITERIEMENRIKQQSQTLVDESRRKDEFLAMLSHELRNPLAPIRSAVHLLKVQQRGSVDRIQKEACEIIERQVGNLTKLVSDLLEVSRVISGRIRLDPQIVDVTQLVEHALQTVAPVIEQRKHQLSVDLGDDRVWLNADSTRIEEVLVNLLHNAAKFTDEGGRIEVQCEENENHALVRVRDNGVGIEPQLLPHIFDLFTQADRSLDRAAGGLGIGLNLAQRLVELHGGTIEARSEGLGKGSEFIVRLPRVAPPLVAAGIAASGRPPQSTDGLYILVVDDNVDACVVLAHTLRLNGHSVQTAHTGPAALQAALAWRPDVLLLDIGLPGLDGYEVARRLRKEPSLKKLRLVAVSGYGSDGDLQKCRDAGFDAHLLKPVHPTELQTLLASWTKTRTNASHGR